MRAVCKMRKVLAKKLLAGMITVVTMLSLLNPIAVMATETTPTPTPVEKTSGGGR